MFPYKNSKSQFEFLARKGSRLLFAMFLVRFLSPPNLGGAEMTRILSDNNSRILTAENRCLTQLTSYFYIAQLVI